MDVLRTALEYFHEKDTFQRSTMGIDRIKGGPWFIRWRVTDLVYVAVLFLISPYIYLLQPFQRQFFINDLSILHPFAEVERVSSKALFFYSTWLPASVIVVLALVITKPANKLYVAYTSALGLVVSVLSADITTNLLKNSFGRHRPDFLARCEPLADAARDIMVFAKDVCTTKDMDRLMDGFRTTPSGHSSISWAGLLYLALWLGGQLTVARPQVGALRWVVVFLPVMGAAFIALGRTEDYRHHFIDVFVGLCLGAGMALWLYYRLFPKHTAKLCYEPKLLSVDDVNDEYSAVAEV